MEARLKTVRILWMALVTTNVIYIGLVSSHLAVSADAAPPHMPALFGAVAFGIAILSIVMPARGFDAALRNMNVNIVEAPGEVIGSFRESAPVTRVIAEPERAMFAAFARYQMPFILGMALAESVSLFGFVLGFMRAGPIVYMPFFAVGIALMLSKFPTEQRIARALERAKNAKLMPSNTSTNR